MHGVFGTAYFSSPEVVEGGKYSEKCDVWSIGVIMYCLLCGQPPFDGESDKEVVKAVIAGKYNLSGGLWDDISDSAKDLLSKVLVREEKRISAKEAFQHPWFEKCKAAAEAKDPELKS